MSKSKIFIYISVVIIIIAFGQYQKSQLQDKVVPVPVPAPVEAVVAPLPTKVDTKEVVNEVAETSPPQVEIKNEVIDQAEAVRPVEVKPVPDQNASKTAAEVNSYSNKSEAMVKPVNNDVVETYTPSPPRVVPLPEIELYMPEKANQTKEEKITEIRNLVTIFNTHLTELYKDKEISYISGEYKVGVLLGDSIEYYEDPVAFEKKSTSSFVKTTMQFIEDVQRLRRQAHQRYMNKNK